MLALAEEAEGGPGAARNHLGAQSEGREERFRMGNLAETDPSKTTSWLVAVEDQLGTSCVGAGNVRPRVRAIGAPELDSVERQSEGTEFESLTRAYGGRRRLRDRYRHCAIDGREDMFHFLHAWQHERRALEGDERDSREPTKRRFEVEVNGIDGSVRKGDGPAYRIVDDEAMGVNVDTAAIAEQVRGQAAETRARVG